MTRETCHDRPNPATSGTGSVWLPFLWVAFRYSPLSSHRRGDGTRLKHTKQCIPRPWPLVWHAQTASGHGTTRTYDPTQRRTPHGNDALLAHTQVARTPRPRSSPRPPATASRTSPCAPRGVRKDRAENCCLTRRRSRTRSCGARSSTCSGVREEAPTRAATAAYR